MKGGSRRGRAWRYTLVAGLALAVGTAGTVAADQLIKSGDIKDHSIQIKDLSKATVKKLRGKTGPSGPQGPAGPLGVAGTNGAEGVDGSPGQAGSSGPGLVAIAGNVTNATTTYTSLAGGSFVDPNGETGAQTPMPPGATLTARDLAVKLRPAAGVAAGTVTVQLVVNGSIRLTCGPIGVGQTSCSTAQTTLLAPGDLVNLRTVATGNANILGALYVFRIVF